MNHNHRRIIPLTLAEFYRLWYSAKHQHLQTFKGWYTDSLHINACSPDGESYRVTLSNHETVSLSPNTSIEIEVW